jgi:hypothetical protein
MKTYKLGNKINGIIRSYSAGPLGQMEMEYANQPYTVLKGVSAEISFRDRTKNMSAVSRVGHYNNRFIDTVKISDVELTDKILNLIFSKSETKLASVVENHTTNENGEVFLNYSGEIYQVFVYDIDGQLETAYGTFDSNQPLVLKRLNEDYVIAYSYEKSFAVDLNRAPNIYLTLDLEIVGNTDDDTSKMYVHIDKCGLEIDNNLFFTQRANAVDLIFKVIPEDNTENYLALE